MAVSQTNRIRELREALEMTSDMLGQELGASGSTVRRLELGQQALTVEWLNRIAQILMVRPVDLLN